MDLVKPAALYDREREWADLLRLLDGKPGRLGVVWGARRVGKSFLLSAFCDAVGGVYVQALRQDATLFLAGLGRNLAQRIDAPAPLRLDDWVVAVDALLDLPGVPLVVLDEFPYLVEAAPELPSVIQAAIDRRRGRSALILCGSAVSQMTSLLDADAPLYRRAHVSMPVTSFDVPTAASYWNLEGRPRDALLVDATVGGTPGYRDVFGPVPAAKAGAVDRWIVEQVLDPTRTTFNEDELVFAADPSLPEANVYRSVLAAIVAGERTPTGIARATGRKATSLVRPIDRLVDAGLIVRTPDPLRSKRGLLDVSDPFLRFHYAIIQPNRLALSQRRAAAVWQANLASFQSQVLGPRFEYVSRAAAASGPLGVPHVARIGASVVYDRARGTSYEVAIVGTDTSGRVVLLGEAKASSGARDAAADIARLERIRNLVPEHVRGDRTHLAVFSLGGFDRRSSRTVEDRDDVTLVDAAGLVAGARSWALPSGSV